LLPEAGLPQDVGAATFIIGRKTELLSLFISVRGCVRSLTSFEELLGFSWRDTFLYLILHVRVTYWRPLKIPISAARLEQVQQVLVLALLWGVELGGARAFRGFFSHLSDQRVCFFV